MNRWPPLRSRSKRQKWSAVTRVANSSHSTPGLVSIAANYGTVAHNHNESREGQHSSLMQMSSDFKSMVNNQEFSDITFTVNGVIYYAHKNILASRSPVFAAMFRSNMSDTHTNNMVIDDYEFEVFEAFLKYIYTGETANLDQAFLNYLYAGETAKSEEYVIQLLSIAHKYKVMTLKMFCENSIKIADKNAIQMLIIADTLNAENLKKKAIDYVIDNLRAIRSLYANEFQSFLKDHPKLVSDIFVAVEKMNHIREDLYEKILYNDPKYSDYW